jgi:hypothetical protein
MRQQDMLSFFSRSQLSTAKRLENQAAIALKDAQHQADAAKMHAAKKASAKIKFFSPGYRPPPAARRQEAARAARRVPKGLSLPSCATELCTRVDFAPGEEGVPRGKCGVFGCECMGLSRMHRHPDCRCGHNAAQHRVKLFLPPFPEVPSAEYNPFATSLDLPSLGEIRVHEENERLKGCAAALRVWVELSFFVDGSGFQRNGQAPDADGSWLRLSTRIENNAGKGAAGGKTRKRKNQKAEERQDEGIAMLLATISMSEDNSEAEMVLAAGDV